MTAALGIHHVTAIASSAQANVDFYAGVLGLRLVKRTVNFDDPATYHLYYGDTLGRPGTILTFFPWTGLRRGRVGTGQVAVTTLAAPPGSLPWWTARLERHGAAPRPTDAGTVAFRDPDGLQLELAEADLDRAGAWGGGSVPAEHAIAGVSSVTVWAAQREPTARVLTDLLGFAGGGPGPGPDTAGFAAAGRGPGSRVLVRQAPDQPHGLMGAGVVHHVAFRAARDGDQLELRRAVAAAGLEPTQVLDRQYFRSVYFREPGGVLFEIATDEPGFTVDEGAERLGAMLRLPPWLAPRQASIAAALPPLDLTALHHARAERAAP